MVERFKLRPGLPALPALCAAIATRSCCSPSLCCPAEPPAVSIEAWAVTIRWQFHVPVPLQTRTRIALPEVWSSCRPTVANLCLAP